MKTTYLILISILVSTNAYACPACSERGYGGGDPVQELYRRKSIFLNGQAETNPIDSEAAKKPKCDFKNGNDGCKVNKD